MAFDMDSNCQLVVFSDKAYNAIITETFDWDPVETGGILLGHILDNGCWIVMETLPPGYGEPNEGDRVFHEYGYFEYNQKFVNYLVKSVSEQYEIPLELLGLWHRHPGSMDHFSGTDDRTNSTFASLNPYGAISGLVNVDPQLRMTMYYLPHNGNQSLINGYVNYQRVDVEVGSDLIPEQYFKLRYYTGEQNSLHPYPPQKTRVQRRSSRFDYAETTPPNEPSPRGYVENKPVNTTNRIYEQAGQGRINSSDYCSRTLDNQKPISTISDTISYLKRHKKHVIIVLALIAFIFSVLSIKKDIVRAFHYFESDNATSVLVGSEIEQKTSVIKERKTNDPSIVNKEKSDETENTPVDKNLGKELIKDNNASNGTSKE